MTTATDQFTEYTARTQEAVTTVIRTWADTVQSVAEAWAVKPALPEAKTVVERYFDFAQQVLDNQRHFASLVIDAGAKAAESVSEQAKSVSEQAKSAVGHAAETVSRQGRQTANKTTEAANRSTEAANRSTEAANRSARAVS